MSQPHLVRSVLRSALQLWLRSLVTQAERLEVTIDAGDRQLLGGRIPGLALQAEQAVYQGLHVSQLTLQASGIHVNLGQILRGKPAQLSEPVSAQLQARISADDLNQSLQSALLAPALMQVTQQLLPEGHTFQVQHIDLAPEHLAFQGQWREGDRLLGLSQKSLDHAAPQRPAQLSAKLTAHGSTIQARAVEVVPRPEAYSRPGHDSLLSPAAPQRLSLPDQSFALGDATLQQLTIMADAILIEAQITILP